MNKHISNNLEIIKTFVEKNTSNFSIQLKRKYKRIYAEINKLEGANFSEKMYRILHNHIGKCIVCDNVTTFQTFTKGYLSTCSVKCRNVIRYNESREYRTCKMCGNSFYIYKKSKNKCCGEVCSKQLSVAEETCKQRVESVKKYNRRKYGVDSFLMTQQFKDKTKHTMNERYGVDRYVNVDKLKKTKYEKYGNANFTNIEKMKSTCMRKYGVDNFSKTKRFKKIQHSRLFERLNRDCQYIDALFTPDDFSGVNNRSYKFECKKCNYTFNLKINNGKKVFCPKCERTQKFKLQYEIEEFISSIYTDKYSVNNRTEISPKELDFYFPDLKLAIEFNGVYWHSEFTGKKHKKYHLEKTLMCETKGIRLIHIFENEWLNSKDILKSKLKHILQKNDSEKIYARKCQIKEIDTKTKNSFLTNTHIQGEDKSKIKLGAFYKNELVSVMTFGSLRKALGHTHTNENEYELIRFATTNKYRCIGIAGKLFSYFINVYTPESIISYADIRYSDGKLYKLLGFDMVSKSSPNYWYFHLNDRSRLYHRFGFRKDQLSKKLESFDSNLSEWQNMRLNGYDRIWDCGNFKFKWTNVI